MDTGTQDKIKWKEREKKKKKLNETGDQCLSVVVLVNWLLNLVFNSSNNGCTSRKMTLEPTEVVNWS